MVHAQRKSIPAGNNTLKSVLIVATLAMTPWLMAQNNLVDQRDQAEGWYLPVHGQVMVDGKPADSYELTVYKDNQEMGKLTAGKKGKFELELDIDQMYTVYITKPGCQPKMMYIDTNLPKDLVKYPDYECSVNLQASSADGVDPFYTDFPSAIVRYSAESGGFYHSEHYLTHIQTRLAGVASATF